MTDAQKIKKIIDAKAEGFQKYRDSTAKQVIEKLNSGKYLNRNDVDKMTSYILEVDEFTEWIISTAKQCATNYALMKTRWHALTQKTMDEVADAKEFLSTPFNLRGEIGDYLYDHMKDQHGQQWLDNWEKELEEYRIKLIAEDV